jgi:uroporphyrinogen-III synthase
VPRAVLITRPEPGCAETAARVAARGLTPVAAPVLEIRPTAVRLPPPDQISAVLLTSGNAADALPGAWHGHRVFAVGEATARRARARGCVDVTSAEGDAHALAALTRSRLVPSEGTLLLACGRGQGSALGAALRGSGFRVARRVVYTAQAVPNLPAAARDALTHPDTWAVMFFSAETARHFIRLVRAAGLGGRLRALEALTIGPRVVVALQGTCWSCVRVAAKPNQSEMLALLR